MPKAKKPATDAMSAENINYVKPVSDFPFVYSNNVSLNLGNLDASIIFGEMVGNDEHGKTIVIPKVKVVMAVPFLKSLSELLASDAVKEHFRKVAEETAATL